MLETCQLHYVPSCSLIKTSVYYICLAPRVHLSALYAYYVIPHRNDRLPLIIYGLDKSSCQNTSRMFDVYVTFVCWRHKGSRKTYTPIKVSLNVPKILLLCSKFQCHIFCIMWHRNPGVPFIHIHFLHHIRISPYCCTAATLFWGSMKTTLQFPIVW